MDPIRRSPVDQPSRILARACTFAILALLVGQIPASAQYGGSSDLRTPTDWRTFTADFETSGDGAGPPRLRLRKGDYPHLELDNTTLHLIGWDVGANLRTPSHDLVEEIGRARDANLPVVVIRVDIATVSQSATKRELNRVRDLVNAAKNYQRWFILALEMDWAPEWYIRSGQPSVQETYVGNRAQDQRLGLSGPRDGLQKIPGQGGMVSPSDVQYLDHCKAFIDDLYYEFHNNPRFLGWILTPPSAPFLYPGLGHEGSAGIADYSAFAQGAFNSDLNYWDEMARREGAMTRTGLFAGSGPFVGTSPPSPSGDLVTTPGGTTAPYRPSPLLPEVPWPPTDGTTPLPLPADPPTDESLYEPARSDNTYGALEEPAAEGTLSGAFRVPPPLPLPFGSTTGHDTRPVWLKWTHFRLHEQQFALDVLGQKIRERDQQRPIFATAWGTLAYKETNGYTAMAWGADPAWIARRPYIDGLIIPFALSSKTFALPSGYGDEDNIQTARALTGLARRYNKVPLMMVEKHASHPPSLQDLHTLQQWCVASGVDPIWSSNGFFTRDSHWQRDEMREIERGTAYGTLPFPTRAYAPQVSILDSPILLSNSYSDQAPRLARAAFLPDILTACGLDYNVVFPQEFPVTGGEIPNLGGVTFLLQSELNTVYDHFNIGFQTAVADHPSHTHVRALDDLALNNWHTNGYGSVPLRSDLLRQMGKLGIASRLRNGPPTLMEINDTYVFYRTLRSGPPPELALTESLDPRDQVPVSFATYFSLNTTQMLALELENGYVDFSRTGNQTGEGPTLIAHPEMLRESREAFTQAKRGILRTQHLSSMRRSLPLILVLTLTAVALGLLFLYQLNVSRRGGFKMYLIRRRQAAAYRTMRDRKAAASGRAPIKPATGKPTATKPIVGKSTSTQKPPPPKAGGGKPGSGRR